MQGCSTPCAVVGRARTTGGSRTCAVLQRISSTSIIGRDAENPEERLRWHILERLRYGRPCRWSEDDPHSGELNHEEHASHRAFPCSAYAI